MGAAAQKQKDAAMAAMLVKSGYPHGRRRTSPRPNSGGLTMTPGPGSAAFQRRDAARADKAERARERELRGNR